MGPTMGLSSEMETEEIVISVAVGAKLNLKVLWS